MVVSQWHHSLTIVTSELAITMMVIHVVCWQPSYVAYVVAALHVHHVDVMVITIHVAYVESVCVPIVASHVISVMIMYVIDIMSVVYVCMWHVAKNRRIKKKMMKAIVVMINARESFVNVVAARDAESSPVPLLSLSSYLTLTHNNGIDMSMLLLLYMML